MQRKRYKGGEYYTQCLKYYIQRYIHKNKKSEICAFTDPVTPQDHSQELLLLGSILYPKCLEQSVDEYADYLSSVKKNYEGRALLLKKFNQLKTFHLYLYKFTLERLNCMVTFKHFAVLFCHYYDKQILQEDRILKSRTMSGASDIYISASNLLLKICKNTIR